MSRRVAEGAPSRAVSTERSTAWLPEIDGLRAIACLAVVLDHYNPWPPLWSLLADGHLGPLWKSTKLLTFGPVGVMLFFTISSFLLTYLAVRERIETGAFSPRNFFIRRTLRIWPLYYTVIVAYVAFAFFVKPHFPGSEAMTDPAGWARSNLLIDVFFLQNWFQTTLPEEHILWSLGVEEQYYLAFPWIMLLIFAGRLPPLVPVAVAMLIGIAFTSAYPLGLRTDVSPYFLTPTHLSVFAFGSVAGWIVGHNRGAWSGASSVLRRFRWPVGLALVGIILVSIYEVDTKFGPHDIQLLTTFPVLGACFATTILWALSNRSSGFSRFLRSRILRDLGLLSYGIYMWHYLVRVLIFYRFTFLDMNALHPDALFALTFVYYVLGSLGVAALTYAAIEAPALRLKDTFAVHGAVRQHEPTRGTRGKRRVWLRYVTLALVGCLSIEAILAILMLVAS